MQYRVIVLLVDGFEEAEAVVPIDIMRRAGMEVSLLAVGDSKLVKGSHGITIVADGLLSEANTSMADLLLLPGGPGTKSLEQSAPVRELVIRFAKADRWIAAICAAPMIPGELGLLQGHQATCYPGYELHLKGAKLMAKEVVVSGKMITACGAGVAFQFGFEIVSQLKGRDAAYEVAKKMMAHLS